MALTEQSVYRIEIVGEEAYRTFQIRRDDQILKDGIVISKDNFHRYILVPGGLVENEVEGEDDVYQRTDVSGQTQEIQNIIGLCWDDAAHTAYEAKLRG